MTSFQKQSGLITGDPAGLMPCLWLGTIVDHWPLWQISANAIHGKPGQFLFDHQIGGTGLQHVTLAGIILPLTTCSDPRAAESLRALTIKYFDDPFQGRDPTLDELVAIRDDLRSIGSLDTAAITYFHKAHEAFLPFACSPSTLLWIRERFQMAIVIEDNDDFLSITLLKTVALPGDSFEEFAAWIGNPNRAEFAGALLYENSD